CSDDEWLSQAVRDPSGDHRENEERGDKDGAGRADKGIPVADIGNPGHNEERHQSLEDIIVVRSKELGDDQRPKRFFLVFSHRSLRKSNFTQFAEECLTSIGVNRGGGSGWVGYRGWRAAGCFRDSSVRYTHKYIGVSRRLRGC